MKKGQIVVEYLILVALLLILALFAIALFSAFPDFAQGIQAKHSMDFWKMQAKPFTILDAFYDKSNGRVYLAIKSNSDDDLTINKLFLNGSQIALFNYSQGASQGVGRVFCNSYTCLSSGCTCYLNMSAFNVQSVASEYFAPPADVCGQEIENSPMSLRIEFTDAKALSNFSQESSFPLIVECKGSFNN